MARAGEAEHWLAVGLISVGIALPVFLTSCAQDQGPDRGPAGPHRPQPSPQRVRKSQGLATPGPNGAVAASCDKVASIAGSDSNRGTVGSPYRTVQHLADSLPRGQTGCLRTGVFDLDDQIKVVNPEITLTAYPGDRATVMGRLWVARGADDVTISNLTLDGRSSFNRGPTVDAANTTFDHVDVTNHHTDICMILGSNSGFGLAIGTVIENSRIHDCGRLPPTNQNHGIYVAGGEGTVIRNNWIYDNADRGIQLYPNSQGTRIYGNVIDGNGEGIVISGDGDTASSNNVIERNLISNSRIRWNVESNWPGGLVGTGNVVRENCVWPSNANSYYDRMGGIMAVPDGAAGFTASGNAIVKPRFQSERSGDLRFQDSGRCLVG